MKEHDRHITHFIPEVILSHGTRLPEDTEVITDSETGRIEYVGTPDGSASFISRLPKPYHIETVASGVLIPGITDAHDHPFSDAISRVMRDPDLGGQTDLPGLLNRLKQEYAKRRDEGYQGSVIARNWDSRIHLTREDLDEVFPDMPLIVLDPSNHGGVVNTPVFEGVEREIDRLGKKPTGAMLSDGHFDGGYGTVAKTLAMQDIPDDRLEESLETILLERASRGTVYMHDLGLRNADNIGVVARLKKRWEDEHGTPFPITRTYVFPSLSHPRPTEVIQEAIQRGFITEDDFRWIGIKLFADDAIGSRGAYLTEEYNDSPGNFGAPHNTPEEMAQVLKDAAELGLYEVAIHAIGDRAIHNALDAAALWKNLADSHGLDPSKIRIAHYELPLPFDTTFGRTKELGVWVDVEPNFLTDYIYRDRLGRGRIAQMQPHRAILDRELPTIAGTDRMPEYPLFAVWCAANALFNSQRLSPEEGLALFTQTPAEYEQDQRGEIKPHKRADVLVFDRNLIRMLLQDPNDILYGRLLGIPKREYITQLLRDFDKSLKAIYSGGRKSL